MQFFQVNFTAQPLPRAPITTLRSKTTGRKLYQSLDATTVADRPAALEVHNRLLQQQLLLHGFIPAVQSPALSRPALRSTVEPDWPTESPQLHTLRQALASIAVMSAQAEAVTTAQTRALSSAHLRPKSRTPTSPSLIDSSSPLHSPLWSISPNPPHPASNTARMMAAVQVLYKPV